MQAAPQQAGEPLEGARVSANYFAGLENLPRAIEVATQCQRLPEACPLAQLMLRS